MILDLRTVIVMTAISCLLMAIVLFGSSKVYPRSIEGLKHWGWGALGFGVANLLFSLRGSMPDWLSVIVANMIGVASFIVWWRGMRLLRGLALSSMRLWYIALAAVLLFLAYFTLVQPNIVPRRFLISGIGFAFYSGMAWLVWRRGQRLQGDYVFISLMVFGCLFTLIRVVATMANPASAATLLTPSSSQTAYVIAYNIMSLMNCIGFFLLATNKLQVELQQMADHDALTGAMNRRALMNKLAIEVAIAQRRSHTIGLITMDLDHFKQINDSLGHDGGDRVLRHFSALVFKNKRPEDLFSRVGGEEFVLVLPDTDLHGAQLVAQRLHAALNTAHGDDLPAYTSSFGVGVWTGAPVAAVNAQFPQGTIDDWFKRVDDAVYRAKAAGRNRIELAAEPTVLV